MKQIAMTLVLMILAGTSYAYDIQTSAVNSKDKKVYNVVRPDTAASDKFDINERH